MWSSRLDQGRGKIDLRLPSVRQIGCLHNVSHLGPEGGGSKFFFFQTLAILPTAQGANTDRHETLKSAKAIPLQARTGREGSRRLRLPDFKTVGT